MTYNFKIALLPDSPDQIEESKQKVMRDAHRFAEQTLLQGAQKDGMDSRMCNLVHDLQCARFWGTLSDIDGYYGPDFSIYPCFESTEETKNRMNKVDATREWAKTNFNEWEIDQIVNIAINQAFLKPRQTPWPGTKRPYTVLYEHIFLNKGSELKAVIDTDLEKRLHNGRFWEGISEMQPGLNGGSGAWHVGNVLAHHYDQLDTAFAPKGLAIIKEIDEGRNRAGLNAYLTQLSDKALPRYADFAQKLYEDSKVPPAFTDMMVKDYLTATLSYDENGELFQFSGPMEDFHTDSKLLYTDLLDKRVVQETLERSLEVRQHLAKRLTGLVKSRDEFGLESTYFKHILRTVPKANEIMRLTMQYSNADDFQKFLASAERYDNNLKPFLPKHKKR